MILHELFEASPGGSDNYAENLAQKVFNVRPNLRSEDDVLNIGYKVAVQDLASQTRAVSLFSRDQDFPSDFVSAYYYLQKQKQGVAEGSLNEFAPGSDGGNSGHWYTDDELADIIGDDWFDDFDVSNDGFNIDAYGEKAKKNLVGHANAWFDDRGYNVNVLGVEHNDVDHDLKWYIVGSFHNDNFADKNIDEGSPRVDSLVTDALKIMRGSDVTDAVAALKTVLGDREYNSRRGHYNFYVRQLMDMYSQQGMAEGSHKNSQAYRADGGANDEDHESDQRREKIEKSGTWYIRLNGKLIKDKQGNPYSFRGKAAANKAALTMQAKLFNQGKEFMLTTNPNDKTQGVVEGSLEANTPNPVVVVQDLKGKILDKVNLSMAVQKYKLGNPQDIKNQLAHQNYTQIGNYVIVSPMSGQPQDATTQGVAEGFNGEYDDEAGMADNNLETLKRAVQGIDDVIQAGDNLPEWCQEKIAVSKSMLVSVWDYMRSEKEKN